MSALGPTIDLPAAPSHHARRATRWRGAAIGLGIALGVAAFEALWFANVWLDVPIGLVGVLPAVLFGAWLGPQAAIGRWGSAAWTVPVMAVGVVLVADAIVVAGLVATSTVGRSEPLAALVVAPLLYLYGLILVGLPMLLLTVPAAIAWFVLLRLWAGR